MAKAAKGKVDPFDVVPGEENTEQPAKKKIRKSPDEKFEALMKKCKLLTIPQKQKLFLWLKSDIEETVANELAIVNRKKAELEEFLGKPE